MNTLIMASSQADAEAVAAVEQHHAQLAGQLGALVDRLVAAVSTGAPGAERDALVAFARTELVPHAQAEEKTMYPAAHEDPAARLLVDAMLAEHVVLVGLVEQIARAQVAAEAAAYGRALQVLFDTHLAKENELVLPLLAADPAVSVAGLLAGMHELLGGETEASHDAPAAAHSCGCGHEHDGGVPELDARAVPHDIRHATIFGALSAVPAGGQMVLVAPHDPLPLLAQIEAREPGAWGVDYTERGPEAWRLLFTRTAGVPVAT